MDGQIIDLCESDDGEDAPSTLRNVSSSTSTSNSTGPDKGTITGDSSSVPNIGGEMMGPISKRYQTNVRSSIGEESDSDLDSIPSASGFRPARSSKPIQKPNVNENKENVTQNSKQSTSTYKSDTMGGDGLRIDETTLEMEIENSIVKVTSSSSSSSSSSSQRKGIKSAPTESSPRNRSAQHVLKEHNSLPVIAERKEKTVDLIDLYSSSEDESKCESSRNSLPIQKKSDPSLSNDFMTNSKSFSIPLEPSKIPHDIYRSDDSDCLYSPSPFERKKPCAYSEFPKDIVSNTAASDERKMPSSSVVPSKMIIVCDSDSSSEESSSPLKLHETMARSDQMNRYVSKNIRIEQLTKSATSNTCTSSSQSSRQKKRLRPSSQHMNSSQAYSSHSAESDLVRQPCSSQNQASNEVHKDQHGSKLVSTPTIPIINQIGGKLYPDLRDQFILALIQHARDTRMAVYNKGVFDACIRAITILALYPFPIRTAEVASNIKGIGKELLEVLKQSRKECKRKPFYPPEGKFSSVTAAALVSLLNYKEMEGSGEFCPVEELVTRINTLVHNPRSGVLLQKEPAFYIKKETIDPGWQQLRKLCGLNTSAGFDKQLIKERKRKIQGTCGVVYELLEEGERYAKRLKTDLLRGILEPGPMRQLASTTVDKEYRNVTMSMDHREGGGGANSLHTMCNLLDDYRVPYVVRDLRISDYVFFVGNKLAPLLIERKSVDDVASSLADGRWERQQHNMRKAQYVLGGGESRKCKISYLIEGDASKRQVHGGFIGRATWRKTIKDVEEAIESLPSLGFSVMTSKTHMGSMNILAKVVRDVAWRHNNGSFDCVYSYDDFIERLNKCPDSYGLPPSDPIHLNPAPPVITQGATMTSMAANNAINSTESDVPNYSESPMYEELMKKTLTELRNMCKERDEMSGGTKTDLVTRLLKQRKPEILITRKRQGQYTPRVPSSNAAILIAMLLHDKEGQGLTKDKIMQLAEETGVSKDPMEGNGGWYNGWAGMKDMKGGDPALVSLRKGKFSLTTQPRGSAGVDVAKAMHILAHRAKLCRCGSFVE